MIYKKEAGAYHKSENGATILTKTFLQKFFCGPSICAFNFFLRFKLVAVIVMQIYKKRCRGFRRKALRMEDGPCKIKFVAA